LRGTDDLTLPFEKWLECDANFDGYPGDGQEKIDFSWSK
jgi:hypothetical protein